MGTVTVGYLVSPCLLLCGNVGQGRQRVMELVVYRLGAIKLSPGFSPRPRRPPAITQSTQFSFSLPLPLEIRNRASKFDMSRASKLTLAGTSLVAAGIVVFVHYAQQAEKAVSNVPWRRGQLPYCGMRLTNNRPCTWG